MRIRKATIEDVPAMVTLAKWAHANSRVASSCLVTSHAYRVASKAVGNMGPPAPGRTAVFVENDVRAMLIGHMLWLFDSLGIAFAVDSLWIAYPDATRGQIGVLDAFHGWVQEYGKPCIIRHSLHDIQGQCTGVNALRRRGFRQAGMVFEKEIAA